MSNHTMLLIFSFLVLTITSSVTAHNITEMLASEPDLSQFNSYLTQTKLADEINDEKTVTVLALTNSAMSSLTPNHPLSAIKNILSLHVLLDYFDDKKLHSLANGTVKSTNLYQRTGLAQNEVGQVNITDLKGGKVGFHSAQPGAKPGPTFVKVIKKIPYSISVVQISEPIIVTSLLTSSPEINVTAVLEKAGCKTFSSLISSSGVLKVYQTQMTKGISIFAPTDEAFKAKGVPDLSKLTNAELVSLLQYHALATYAPHGTLKTAKGPLSTLAAGAGKFSLSATTAGDEITLHTGVDSSRVANTLVDQTPVVIYSVDSLLMPVELFGMSPAPAPAPESDTPTPAPSPSPKAESPAPGSAPAASPPAPSMDTPAGAPSEADSPGSSADDNTKNAAAGGKCDKLVLSVILSVVSCVISLVL